ncbi:hypothetical protein [Streptomyces phaeochromogenes]
MNLRPPVDDRRNAADATEATVVLTCEDGMLRVLVRDDGRGGTQMPQLPVAADPASFASPNASRLDAGLSTQVIRAILPCLESPRDPIVFHGVTSETVAVLERERDRLTERVDVLARNRDAIGDYLAELQRRAG